MDAHPWTVLASRTASFFHDGFLEPRRRFLFSSQYAAATESPTSESPATKSRKVAITNFKEGLITVVVESKYIRETFEKIFEYIWQHG